VPYAVPGGAVPKLLEGWAVSKELGCVEPYTLCWAWLNVLLRSTSTSSIGRSYNWYPRCLSDPEPEPARGTAVPEPEPVDPVCSAETGERRRGVDGSLGRGTVTGAVTAEERDEIERSLDGAGDEGLVRSRGVEMRESRELAGVR
jgi:hypothetical protein